MRTLALYNKIMQMHADGKTIADCLAALQADGWGSGPLDELCDYVYSGTPLPKEIKEELESDKRKARWSQSGMTASGLMQKVFAAVSWLIDTLFPCGLILLVGKPKIGKSWLALLIAIKVALGESIFQKLCDRGRVLYLALEDNPRRLKSRLSVIGASPTDSLHFFTEWPRQGAGGIEKLAEWLQDWPDTRLIVIDTLQRFRKAQGNKNAYEADYAALGELHRLTVKHECSIMVLHHQRKGAADDILDTISNSTAISGACDTIAVLTRSRSEADAELFITGRDVDEHKLALKFDQGEWDLLGDADEVALSDARRDIIDCLDAAEGKPVSGKQVSTDTGRNYSTLKTTLRRMVSDGQIQHNSKGYYHE